MPMKPGLDNSRRPVIARKSNDSSATAKSRTVKKARIATVTTPVIELVEESEALPIKPSQDNAEAAAGAAGRATSVESGGSVRVRASKTKRLEESHPLDQQPPHLYGPPLTARHFELDPFSSDPPSINPNINTIRLKRNCE